MAVAFCSIEVLDDAILDYDPDAVVSVWSPRWPMEDIVGRQHLHLIMDDIEERTLDNRWCIPPDHDHVEAFAKLLTGLKPNRLLVQCTAGLSRSPALALIAAVYQGAPALDVAQSIKSKVGHAQPNRRLLQAADEVLGGETLRAAIQTFNYTRDRSSRPDGERSGLVEVMSQGALDYARA